MKIIVNIKKNSVILCCIDFDLYPAMSRYAFLTDENRVVFSEELLKKN